MSDENRKRIEERIKQNRATFQIKTGALQGAKEQELEAAKKTLKPLTDTLEELAKVSLPDGYSLTYDIKIHDIISLEIKFLENNKESLENMISFTLQEREEKPDLMPFWDKSGIFEKEKYGLRGYDLTNTTAVNKLKQKLEDWFVAIVGNDFDMGKVNPTVTERVTIRSVPDAPSEPE